MVTVTDHIQATRCHGSGKQTQCRSINRSALLRPSTTHQQAVMNTNTYYDFRDAGFRDLFALYRASHPACYALAIAYGIAFDNIPF